MSGLTPALTRADILQVGIDRAHREGDYRRAAELRARLQRERPRRHRRTRAEAGEARQLRLASRAHGGAMGCREHDGQLCRIRGCDWWRGWQARGGRSP